MSTVKDRTIKFIKFKGITMKTFEQKCDLSTGYVTSMRKGYGVDKLNNVLTAYPDLNREWLLYGEGEMLKPNISQNANGNNNTQVAGNDNHVNSDALDKAIAEIGEQRKLVAKSQEQIDRLLVIIEKMQLH